MKEENKRTHISWTVLFVFVLAIFAGMLQYNRMDVHAAKSMTFKTYYKKVLVPQYGVFKKTQTGTMTGFDNKWLKTKGIMGVRVMDYDMDGKKEMLVICAEADNSNDSKIMLKMYEHKKGNVVLASEIRFNPYYDGTETDAAGDIVLTAKEWKEDAFFVNVVQKKKSVYIVCEENQGWGYFADGSQQDYWVLSYKNNQFQYVRSYSQTGGGSSDFEYTAFTFNNKGKLKKSLLYYSEEGTDGKYQSFSKALKAFFRPCGIKLKNNISEYGVQKSVLSPKNKSVQIFSFKNKVVQSSYNPTKIKLRATLNAKNKF